MLDAGPWVSPDPARVQRPARERRHGRLLKSRWLSSGVCLCLGVRFHAANKAGKPRSGGWTQSQPETQHVTFEALSLPRVLPSSATGSLNAFFSRFQSLLHPGSPGWHPPDTQGRLTLCSEVPSGLFSLRAQGGHAVSPSLYAVGAPPPLGGTSQPPAAPLLLGVLAKPL